MTKSSNGDDGDSNVTTHDEAYARMREFMQTEFASCLAAVEPCLTPEGDLAIRGIIGQNFEFMGGRHERGSLIQLVIIQKMKGGNNNAQQPGNNS